MSKPIWQPIAIFCICLIINMNFYVADALEISHEPETQVTVMADSAQISWTTDEEADSEVNYGVNKTQLDKKEKSTEQVLSHLILLGNLLPATTYYYELIATMANGTSARDNNSDQYYSFTTAEVEVAELFLNATVKERYNTNMIDIPGTTTPNSNVWLYINPTPEEICTPTYDYSTIAGDDGSFTLTDVRLEAQNNLVICVKDPAGNTLSQSFDVTVDVQKPEVNFTLPESAITTSLALNGTVNEKVKIFYTVGNETKEKDAEPGTFSLTLTLQGDVTNDVTVAFVDPAGNLVEYSAGIFIDTEVPKILKHNIPELTPSYSQEVIIKGQVNKPDIDVIVFVNDKAKILTAEEEIEFAGFESVVGMAKLIITWVVQKGEYRTKSDAQGNFEVAVLLEVVEEEVARPEVIPVERPPTAVVEALPPTGLYEEERAIVAELRREIPNRIKILAIDKAGRTAQQEGLIKFVRCGFGIDWRTEISDISPRIITPDLLRRGFAQLGFTVDLEWQGPGKDPRLIGNIRVTALPISEEYAKEYPIDPRELFSTQSIHPTPCSVADGKAKCYVMINLNKYNYTQNLSQPRSFIVRLPMMMEIEYDYEREEYPYPPVPGVWENVTALRPLRVTKTQRECWDGYFTMDIEVDIGAIIPKEFLEGSIEVFNATIYVLDKIIKFIKIVAVIAFGICVASWIALYVMRARQLLECRGKSPRGLTGEKLEEFKREFQSCFEAYEEAEKTEVAMRWICDRIFCPSALTLKNYVMQARKMPQSACAEASLSALEDEKSPCVKEYKKMYDTTCVGLNEWEESLCIDEINVAKCGNFMQQAVRAVRSISSGLCDADRQGNLSGYSIRRPDGTEQPFIRRADGTWCLAEKAEWFKPRKIVGPGGVVEEKPAAIKGTGEVVGEWECAKGNEIGGVTQWTRGEYRLVKGFDETAPAGEIKPIEIEPDQPVSAMRRGLHGNIIFTDPHDRRYGGRVYYEYQYKDEETGELKTGYKPLSNVELLEGRYGISLAEGDFEAMVGAGKATLTKKETIKCDGKDFTGKFYKYANRLIAFTEENGKTVRYVREIVEGKPGPCRKLRPEEDIPLELKFRGEDLLKDIKGNPVEAPPAIRHELGRAPQRFAVNPKDGIVSSVQCVCIPGINGHLILWKRILDAVKRCFQEILMGGTGSTSYCRSILSTYVCDLVFFAIRCFTRAFSAGPALPTTEIETGIGGFMKALSSAGAEVQESIVNRYGRTAIYETLFGKQKLMHAACLWAFTGDWDLNLENIVGGIEAARIKSEAFIYPATRRYMTHDPTPPARGRATFVYNIGVGIIAGAPLMYDVYLICSEDNSCDPKEGFEGGTCDCAWPLMRGKIAPITPLRINAALGLPGRIEPGEMVGPINGYVQRIRDSVRYDKVRIVGRWKDDKGVLREEPLAETPITAVGGTPPLECKFDPFELFYRCSFDFGEKGYAIFTEPPRPAKDIFYLNELVIVNIRGVKRSPGYFEDRPETHQNLIPKFLEYKLKDHHGNYVDIYGRTGIVRDKTGILEITEDGPINIGLTLIDRLTEEHFTRSSEVYDPGCLRCRAKGPGRGSIKDHCCIRDYYIFMDEDRKYRYVTGEAVRGFKGKEITEEVWLFRHDSVTIKSPEYVKEAPECVHKGRGEYRCGREGATFKVVKDFKPMETYVILHQADKLPQGRSLTTIADCKKYSSPASPAVWHLELRFLHAHEDDYGMLKQSNQAVRYNNIWQTFTGTKAIPIKLVCNEPQVGAEFGRCLEDNHQFIGESASDTCLCYDPETQKPEEGKEVQHMQYCYFYKDDPPPRVAVECLKRQNQPGARASATSPYGLETPCDCNKDEVISKGECKDMVCVTRALWKEEAFAQKDAEVGSCCEVKMERGKIIDVKKCEKKETVVVRPYYSESPQGLKCKIEPSKGNVERAKALHEHGADRPEGPASYSAGKVRITGYYTPNCSDFVGNWPKFYEDVRMQGSGICDGKVYSFKTIGLSRETSKPIKDPEKKYPHGRTACHTNPKPNRTIAVNAVPGTYCHIPYGSRVYLDFGDKRPWTGWYVAEDTGGGFHGKCAIDIYTGVGARARTEAMDISLKKVKVWVEPPPAALAPLPIIPPEAECADLSAPGVDVKACVNRYWRRLSFGLREDWCSKYLVKLPEDQQVECCDIHGVCPPLAPPLPPECEKWNGLLEYRQKECCTYFDQLREKKAWEAVRSCCANYQDQLTSTQINWCKAREYTQ